MSMERPPMHQTMTPFVEFYMNGVDILRSSDGTPRTLVSFAHYNKLNGMGDWSLEVFDPSYVAIEELAFITAHKGSGTEVAEDQYKDAEPGDAEKTEIAHPVMFRYGYVSKDGVEIAVPPDGMEYFVGTANMYVPTMQPNGTLIAFTGFSTWKPATQKSSRIHSTFHDTSIMDIVRKICKRMEWTLVPLTGAADEDIEFPEGHIPEDILDCSCAIDTTEEQHLTIRMYENESEFDFITRLLNMARPNDQKLNEYACRLEYRAAGDPKAGADSIHPKGFLYYGPKDMQAAPVRDYVYMRDPGSDIISFSPSIAVFVPQATGQSGAVVKFDNKRTGEVAVHEYNEVDRYLKYFPERRLKMSLTLAEMGQLQEGVPEKPEDTERVEGGVTDTNVPAPAQKPDVNNPDKEMSSHVTNGYVGDRQMMNHWLLMSAFVTTATVEIFGDPSPEINAARNIAIYVFVPTGEGQFEVHWTSSVWQIMSASHHIDSGSYVTRLDLMKNATAYSGITSKAASQSLAKKLGRGGMRKVGG